MEKKMKKRVDRSSYLFDNKALLALIIPLVIEQLLAVLVGMADSIMIASVGEAAVSGVSLVDQIMVLLINVFAALATGGAVVAGQYLGQKNQKEACKSATQLVWFITLCSVVITLLVYAGKYFILHGIFGKIEADVMGHANTYLMIVTASIPFMALYNGGAAIFRAMGNSKVSMQVSIIMNIINVGGNAILIYGFHRGTEGVAIPTLVSRMVAAVIIIVLLCNPNQLLHIERTFRYKFNWQMVKKILSIGVPNGLENSMFQLGKILGFKPGIHIWNLRYRGKCGGQRHRPIPDTSRNGNIPGGYYGDRKMRRGRRLRTGEILQPETDGDHLCMHGGDRVLHILHPSADHQGL